MSVSTAAADPGHQTDNTVTIENSPCAVVKDDRGFLSKIFDHFFGQQEAIVIIDSPGAVVNSGWGSNTTTTIDDQKCDELVPE